jgi:hypothetical protein
MAKAPKTHSMNEPPGHLAASLQPKIDAAVSAIATIAASAQQISGDRSSP